MSSSSTLAAATASASSANSVPTKYRPVGVALAIGSGVLIGSSFVFKKKGLLSSQKGHAAGEGVAYLKSPLWWIGMTIMILGELCNFGAYAFLEAIIVTPMGALSVVICAILSHFILKEKLSLFGWIASLQCILGATILALNGPEEQSVTTIDAFKKLFLAPGFLSYGSVVIAAAVVLAVFVAPRYGQRSMLPWIGICSLIGGLSVSCTQGLGACIVTSIRGDNQFKNWFIYFLLAFVAVTLLTEIYYLNVALAMFNTAMVTPTYYVMFTFCTLVTSVILYQGLKASATQIMTVVLGFCVICTGIFILQMSKVDPRQLTNLDRRTTLLLQAARAEIDPKSARQLEREGTVSSRMSRRRATSAHSLGNAHAPHAAVDGADLEANADGPRGTEDLNSDVVDLDSDEDDAKAVVQKTEEPGMDALRGTFGAVGTFIRARRRATVLSQARSARSRTSSVHSGASDDLSRSRSPRGNGNGTVVMKEKDGVDPEKADFRREALARATSANGDGGRLFVTSPLATPSLAEVRRAASVHFAGGDSVPVTQERSESEPDPMAQAGVAVEEAAKIRAQTLPPATSSSSSSERRRAGDVIGGQPQQQPEPALGGQ